MRAESLRNATTRKYLTQRKMEDDGGWGTPDEVARICRAKMELGFPHVRPHPDDHHQLQFWVTADTTQVNASETTRSAESTCTTDLTPDTLDRSAVLFAPHGISSGPAGLAAIEDGSTDGESGADEKDTKKNKKKKDKNKKDKNKNKGEKQPKIDIMSAQVSGEMKCHQLQPVVASWMKELLKDYGEGNKLVSLLTEQGIADGMKHAPSSIVVIDCEPSCWFEPLDPQPVACRTRLENFCTTLHTARVEFSKVDCAKPGASTTVGSLVAVHTENVKQYRKLARQVRGMLRAGESPKKRQRIGVDETVN